MKWQIVCRWVLTTFVNAKINSLGMERIVQVNVEITLNFSVISLQRSIAVFSYRPYPSSKKCSSQMKNVWSLSHTIFYMCPYISTLWIIYRSCYKKLLWLIPNTLCWKILSGHLLFYFYFSSERCGPKQWKWISK